MCDLTADELVELRAFLSFQQKWLRDGLTPAERKFKRRKLIERVGKSPLMFRLTDAGARCAVFGCRSATARDESGSAQ